MGVEFILLLPGPAGKPSVGQHGGVRLSLAGYEDTQDTAQWPCSVAPKSSYTNTLSGKWSPVIWKCCSKYLVKEKQRKSQQSFGSSWCFLEVGISLDHYFSYIYSSYCITGIFFFF